MKGYEQIFLAGTGRVAADCLAELVKHDPEAEYICVDEDKGGYMEKFCARGGIPYHCPGRAKARDFLMSIESRSLIVSVHNAYLFPAEVVAKKNLKIINLHIAFLPEYRGRNAPTWEIFNHEEFGGATWHVVNSRIDDGELIVQERVPVYEDDTAMKLMLRSWQAGIKLFRENAADFAAGTFRTRPYAYGNTRVYLSKELPNGGVLNPEWSFREAWAFLRSMDYKGTDIMPLPRVVFDGSEYEIVSYRREQEDESGGQRFVLEGDSLAVNLKGGKIVCVLRKIGLDKNEEACKIAQHSTAQHSTAQHTIVMS